MKERKNIEYDKYKDDSGYVIVNMISGNGIDEVKSIIKCYDFKIKRMFIKHISQSNTESPLDNTYLIECKKEHANKICGDLNCDKKVRYAQLPVRKFLS